jgi:hypothetical protein
VKKSGTDLSAVRQYLKGESLQIRRGCLSPIFSKPLAI